MNQNANEKMITALERGKQVMIFVHSRKETSRTAEAMRDLTAKVGMSTLLDNFGHDLFGAWKRAVEKSRSTEVQQLFFKVRPLSRSLSFPSVLPLQSCANSPPLVPIQNNCGITSLHPSTPLSASITLPLTRAGHRHSPRRDAPLRPHYDGADVRVRCHQGAVLHCNPRLGGEFARPHSNHQRYESLPASLHAISSQQGRVFDGCLCDSQLSMLLAPLHRHRAVRPRERRVRGPRDAGCPTGTLRLSQC